MKTPYLNPIQTNKPMLNSFAGINRGERIDYTVNKTTVGEWAEAENLTTEQYPVAMTRDRRVVLELRARAAGTSGDGYKAPLFEGEGQDACEVDGDVYVSYWMGNPYNLGCVIKGTDFVETAGKPKQIVKFGRGIFASDGTFIPYTANEMTAQKVRIAKSSQVGIEIAEASGRSITTRWLYKGEQYDPTNPDSYKQDSSWAVADTEHPVVDVQNGEVWFDTANGGEYSYDSTSENWDFIGDSYVLLVGVDLHEGDFVHIKTTRPYIDGNFTVVKTFEQVGTNNISGTITQVTWHCALIKLTIPYGAGSQGALVRFTRRCPVFDYICANRNRIWGCRYGLNDEGEFVNEIYASELGNATNFFRIQDKVADESWIASVGTGGEWTGCVAVEDNVYFFKEDRIYMVSGTDPSNFSYKEIEGPGVAPGMYKSIIVKDGAVYYAATRGIYRITAYNYPVCIDEKRRQSLGMDVVGVADKDFLRWADFYKVVVYDMKLGAWMEEQGLGEYPFAALLSRSNPLLFCNDPYYNEEFDATITSTDVVRFHDLLIDTTLPSRAAIPGVEFFWESVFEGKVGWFAETGLKGLGDPEPKRVKNIKIRLKTEEDTDFRVFIKLDEDETWIPVADEKRAKAGTYLVRYVPDRRCDLYRLRFEGKGHTVIYSITEEYENAGDVSVGL